MKVKINTSLSGLNFSYKKGDEVEIEGKRAKQWIKAGVAMEIKPQGNTKKTNITTKSKNSD